MSILAIEVCFKNLSFVIKTPTCFIKPTANTPIVGRQLISLLYSITQYRQSVTHITGYWLPSSGGAWCVHRSTEGSQWGVHPVLWWHIETGLSGMLQITLWIDGCCVGLLNRKTQYTQQCVPHASCYTGYKGRSKANADWTLSVQFQLLTCVSSYLLI